MDSLAMIRSVISDDEMRSALATAREYTLVLLRYTPRRQEPGADAIVWEHGRRNFELRASGELTIVGPLGDGEFAGLCIFATDLDRTRALMDADPAIAAGIFTYELQTLHSFPGDAL
jgi:uncharacterized protein YciI